jgi:hypothetical protein
MATERVASHTGVWSFENLHGQSNFKMWYKKLANAFRYEGWERLLDEDEPSVLADTMSIDAGVDANGNPIYRRPNAAEFAANAADIKEYRLFNRRGWACMYNKIDEALVLQIDDYTTVFEAIVHLHTQYMDMGFTAKHTAGQS